MVALGENCCIHRVGIEATSRSALEEEYGRVVVGFSWRSRSWSGFVCGGRSEVRRSGSWHRRKGADWVSGGMVKGLSGCVEWYDSPQVMGGMFGSHQGGDTVAPALSCHARSCWHPHLLISNIRYT